MSNRIELNMLLILVLVIISMAIRENSGRLNNQETTIHALELTLAEYGIVAVKDTQKLIIIKQDELIKHRNADIYNEISMIENRRPYAEEMIPTTRQECGTECHITEEER